MKSGRQEMVSDPFYSVEPLKGASFGVRLCLNTEAQQLKPSKLLQLFTSHKLQIVELFHRSSGLMAISGLHQIKSSPKLLVGLSYLFGPEVENYHQTLTSERFFHDSIAEILVLSNDPPCSHPPPDRPEWIDGELPVQFPHQLNWHTDQSYRRPPPDVSLLYAITTPPNQQGQTLYADCTSAYAALDQDIKDQIENLNGIHAPSWVGRSRAAVENNENPISLLAHQLPQCHPLVRYHPVTGKPSLFICEENQMDFVDGPIENLDPGPEGEGARLLRKLLVHSTQKSFTYTHHWESGDLLIGDNRCLLHCATWYDANKYSRLMWRTTVSGNPGKYYQGESKSWIPSDGVGFMQGMENV